MGILLKIVIVLLPFLVLISAMNGSTVGHGKEKVLLRYHYQVGDKYTFVGQVFLKEKFDGKGVRPESLEAFQQVQRQVVQKIDVDETAAVDIQNLSFKHRLNGRDINDDVHDTALHQAYVDPTGRAANVPGSMEIHFADEIGPTELYTELPREAVSVGAEWDSAYQGLSFGPSTAHCILTGIEHQKGKTFAKILMTVRTRQTGIFLAGDTVKPTPVDCDGRTLLLMVFDVTDGRYLEAAGVGKIFFGRASFRNGAVVINSGTGTAQFRLLFSKSL